MSADNKKTKSGNALVQIGAIFGAAILAGSLITNYHFHQEIAQLTAGDDVCRDVGWTIVDGSKAIVISDPEGGNMFAYRKTGDTNMEQITKLTADMQECVEYIHRQYDHVSNIGDAIATRMGEISAHMETIREIDPELAEQIERVNNKAKWVSDMGNFSITGKWPDFNGPQ